MLSRLAGHAAAAAGRVPQHITPGVQRLVDRLPDVPVSVYDAAWTMLSWNQPWAGLIGDASVVKGRDRNLIWRCFTGASSPIEHADPGQHEDSLVADLHEVMSRYPGDGELTAMVSDLRRISKHFAARWEHPTVARHRGERKTVHNPAVGDITLDCDVLTVHGDDLRVVVFTAAPKSPDADKLAVLNVIGSQVFSPTYVDE